LPRDQLRQRLLEPHCRGVRRTVGPRQRTDLRAGAGVGEAGGEEVSVMAAKVLILAGDAAESLEVLYPYQRLREEGYEVHIAGPSKKKLQFVVHDFVEGYDTYTEKPGYTWNADLAFADVDPSDYVAMVVPGGRAPEYIRNDPDVQRIVRAFFTDDKP